MKSETQTGSGTWVQLSVFPSREDLNCFIAVFYGVTIQLTIVWCICSCIRNDMVSWNLFYGYIYHTYTHGKYFDSNPDWFVWFRVCGFMFTVLETPSFQNVWHRNDKLILIHVSFMVISSDIVDNREMKLELMKRHQVFCRLL